MDSEYRETSDATGSNPPTLADRQPSEQPPDVSAIVMPQALAQRRQWVAWRTGWRDGKSTRIPVNANTGGAGKTSVPDTWTDLATATNYCDREGVDGVGFVFTEGDDLVGVDLDNCRDPETGEISDFAHHVVDALDSYTEISPSGRGIHVIVKGALPAGWRKRADIEMYDTGRYFTMTGHRLPDTPPDVEDRCQALEELRDELGRAPRPGGGSERQTGPSDADIVAKAAAEPSRRFGRLWGGDLSNHPSQSEADLALCGHLGRLTRGDASRVDSLFRRSRLFRPKWDESRRSDGRTYGQITVQKAVGSYVATDIDHAGNVEDRPDTCATLVEAANQNAKIAVAAVLDDDAAMDDLASLAEEGPARFESLLMKLRNAGVVVRDVDALRRAVRSGHSRPTDNSTQAEEDQQELEAVHVAVPDAPVPAEISVPRGWELRDDGLACMRQSRDGDGLTSVEVAPTPILIDSRYKDIVDGTELISLRWRRDGKWQQHVAPRGEVADTSSIVKLANVGLPVTSGNARDLVRYLAEFEAQNIDDLPLARISSRMGWLGKDGEDGFLHGKELLTPDSAPGREVIFRGNDVGESQIADGFGVLGEWEQWRDAVESIHDHPRVLVAVLASLAPPLLSILGAPNFIVDWSYATSTGKTSTLRLAASCWGNPDERLPNSALWTWDTTRVWRERACACLNGLPIILDDTKRARKPQDVSQTLYDVASGRGRGRGSAGGLREAGSWTTVLLSSGETRATDFTQDGGTRARTLSLWGPPFGATTPATAQVVNTLNRVIRENYGQAGRRFTRYLMEHRDQKIPWREMHRQEQERYEKKIQSDAVAGRLSGYLATLSVTATLARAALDMPWLTPKTVDRIRDDVVAEGGDADRATTALAHVISYARAHEHAFWGRHERFDGTPRASAGGWMGRWDQGEGWNSVAFYPHRLNVVLQDAGFDVEATIRLWRERGWINIGDDRKRYTRKMRVASESAWVVDICREAIELAEGK